jgi:hypothetical protein
MADEERTPVPPEEAIAELEHDIAWRQAMIGYLRDGLWKAERSPSQYPLTRPGELHFLPTPAGIAQIRGRRTEPIARP